MSADLSDRTLVRRLSDALQAVAKIEGASRPNAAKLTAAQGVAADLRRELGMRLIDGRWQAWDALGVDAAPAGRRENRSGSIYHDRKRDRFVAEVTIDGQRYRHLARSKADAEKWIAQAVKRARDGMDVHESRHTVESWLEHCRTAVWPLESLRPKTLENHSDAIDRWWLPTIGSTRLTALRPEQVETVVQSMVAKGLSPNTCRILTAPLIKALNLAVQRGEVTRNVASLAKRPRVENVREAKFLTPDEARRLLAECSEARFGDAIALAMLTGMRRGEVLGLAWDRVTLDGDRATLTIDQQLASAGEGPTSGTKTGRKGVRSIVLPAVAVDVLRRRRARQAAEKLAAGDGWVNAHNLVFTTPIGTPIAPRNFGHAVEKLAVEVLGRKLHPHALRHTAASLLHEAGVSMKVAQTILGHTGSDMTAFYTHTYSEAHDRAAAAMDALLASGS